MVSDPPLQKPRNPIWVAGTWPGTRPFTRVVRWDGWSRCARTGTGTFRTPRRSHQLRSLRTGDHHVDVAVSGESNGTDNHRAAQFAQHEHAGATWWVEAIHPWRYGWNEGLAWPLDAMENRNAQRP